MRTRKHEVMSHKAAMEEERCSFRASLKGMTATDRERHRRIFKAKMQAKIEAFHSEMRAKRRVRRVAVIKNEGGIMDDTDEAKEERPNPERRARIRASMQSRREEVLRSLVAFKESLDDGSSPEERKNRWTVRMVEAKSNVSATRETFGSGVELRMARMELNQSRRAFFLDSLDDDLTGKEKQDLWRVEKGEDDRKNGGRRGRKFMGRRSFATEECSEGGTKGNKKQAILKNLAIFQDSMDGLSPEERTNKWIARIADAETNISETRVTSGRGVELQMARVELNQTRRASFMDTLDDSLTEEEKQSLWRVEKGKSEQMRGVRRGRKCMERRCVGNSDPDHQECSEGGTKEAATLQARKRMERLSIENDNLEDGCGEGGKQSDTTTQESRNKRKGTFGFGPEKVCSEESKEELAVFVASLNGLSKEEKMTKWDARMKELKSNVREAKHIMILNRETRRSKVSDAKNGSAKEGSNICNDIDEPSAEAEFEIVQAVKL